MTKVYVVMGTTGEYSDRREWTVAAYTDRALADRHSDRAAERAHRYDVGECQHGERQMGAYCIECDHMSTVEVGRRFMAALDPRFDCDYTGTNYYVVEAPLLSAVPEVES